MGDFYFYKISKKLINNNKWSVADSVFIIKFTKINK